MMHNTPITHGLRVFTCGHSFHSWVAPTLKELADAAGLRGHEVAGVQAVGGSAGAPPYVNHHWNIPDEKNDLKRALREGKTDVLTLSPIWLPDEGIDKFAAMAFEHNADVRVTVQAFWLPNDVYETTYPLATKRPPNHNAAKIDELRTRHAPYFESVDANVRRVNAALGKAVAFVVPVGQAVLGLREKIVAGEAAQLVEQEDLFNEGWGHPLEAIRVLAAYCHFAVIYRRDPRGLPMPAPDAMVSVWNEKRAWRDEKLNRLLQDLAWDAVRGHALSGVE